MKIFNNCQIFFVAALASLAVSNLPARAAYVDITVNDGGPSSGPYIVQNGAAAGQQSGDPRPGINESGSVSTNCVANASWDLRAIAFDVTTNKLVVVSGFNPQKLNEGVSIGDIFVDTNTSYTNPSRTSLVLTDPKIDPTKDGQFSYYNSTPGVGFEYAIHLIDPATGNLSYNIAALSGASILQSAAYVQNASSDPAKLIASGADTVLSSRFFDLTTKTDAQVLSDLGINIGTNGGYFDGQNFGPDNYVFSFDLTGVSLANGATFRLTTTCGNDLLVGQLAAGVAAVPETSTWVMGFLALGAVAFMVRRNAKAVLS